MRDGGSVPMEPVKSTRGTIAALPATNGGYTDGHLLTSDRERAAVTAAGYHVFIEHRTVCPDWARKPEEEVGTDELSLF